MTYKPHTFLVKLQWPYKELNPNNRGHWAVQGKWAKQAKADAYQECMVQKPDCTFIYPNDTYIGIRIFYPPNTGRNSGRQWDSDNLAASLKAYQDGIFSFFKDRIDQAIDDRQVINTINRVIYTPTTRAQGQVLYHLVPETITAWIHTIPEIIANHPVYKSHNLV